MINRVNISRWNRIFNLDSTDSLYCKAKLWYIDVFENCNCKNKCQYTNYTKEDWVKYSNQCFIDSCIKNAAENK